MVPAFKDLIEKKIYNGGFIQISTGYCGNVLGGRLWRQSQWGFEVPRRGGLAM
jgi:hypothetical protein